MESVWPLLPPLLLCGSAPRSTTGTGSTAFIAIEQKAQPVGTDEVGLLPLPSLLHCFLALQVRVHDSSERHPAPFAL